LKATLTSISCISPIQGHPIAGIGFDLASLNIQRARDHGIPKYNALRFGLGLSPATSFANITSNPTVQQALRDAYGGKVDTIDAWIGGLAEEHVSGGLVGELFATLIGDQFERLMHGDPFFFLNDEDLQDRKLREEVMDVSTVKLSDIMATNTDLIDFWRRKNVFEHLGSTAGKKKGGGGKKSKKDGKRHLTTTKQRGGVRATPAKRKLSLD
jgi:peroxidase